MSFLCIKCGDENDNSVKFCKNCGNQISNDIIEPHKEYDEYGQEKILSERQKYNSIGGWLNLLGIGLIFSPFVIIAQLMPIYKDIVLNKTFEILFKTNFPLALTMLAEIFINILVILGFFYSIYTFFTKKKIFIKLYSGLTIFVVFFMIGDAIITSSLLDNPQIFDKETTKDIARSAIFGAIWITYLFSSDRARLTFVN